MNEARLNRLELISSMLFLPRPLLMLFFEGCKLLFLGLEGFNCGGVECLGCIFYVLDSFVKDFFYSLAAFFGFYTEQVYLV